MGVNSLTPNSHIASQGYWEMSEGCLSLINKDVGGTMDFIAFDFETANEQRASACEISLVKVSGGIVGEKYTSLIKPHASMPFNPWNVQIHGITPGDVKNAPEFDSVIQDVVAFSAGLPLVAHNASFDMSVMRRTSELYSVSLPELEFYCTRILAQRSPSIDLPSYALVNVCDALGIPFDESHRAEADAEACAQVAISLAASASANNLADLATSLLVKPGSLSLHGYTGISSQKGSKAPSAFSKGSAQEFLASLTPDDMSFDDDFVGKEVIFTGTLGSMERKLAQEKVLRAGGITGSGVTKKTSIVVVGAPYDSELKPGGTISGKIKKVIELRDKGADIRLITEPEFLELFEN